MVAKFSKKQLKVLSWWEKSSPLWSKTAIICDGAVRSGKTFSMGLGFVLWATHSFAGQNFAFCGKTKLSLRRNLAHPLMKSLTEIGFSCTEKASQGYVDIGFCGRQNRFYLFGGKDEGAAAHIQGMTLAGVLFDEVALLPRSFVEQALARCSVEGSRFWFNCNPDHPYHWFYREWIVKRREKEACYFHFTMDDNPALSVEVKNRYRSLYTGMFYRRFIRGEWVAAEGLVYPGFKLEKHSLAHLPQFFSRYVISCDYGTANPSSFGLWGLSEGVWYRLREAYYDSRAQGAQRTDGEQYAALAELAGDLPVELVVVDPSAASFIELIRREGRFTVEKANNDVVNGIRLVADALQHGQIRFGEGCTDSFREFALYRWDERKFGDRVVQENDHAMDDIRYFVATVLWQEESDFFVGAIPREG